MGGVLATLRRRRGDADGFAVRDWGNDNVSPKRICLRADNVTIYSFASCSESSEFRNSLLETQQGSMCCTRVTACLKSFGDANCDRNLLHVFFTKADSVALPSGAMVTIGTPFVFRRGPFVVGAPFFSPFFWGGAVVVQQPTPQPFILEVAPSQVETKEEPKPSSLLIERQGDRYVRISGVPEEISFTQRGKATNAPELSPTVLVFRDGRRMEVTNYAIVDKALYAYGDYWTAGYWTREILLAELDLPTTISLNLERGVKFQLPSAPNEVITRP